MSLLVVLSGGLDSSTALASMIDEGKKVALTVHFQYGAKHNFKELRAAALIADHYEVPIEVINLPFISESFKSHLLQKGDAIPDGHYEDHSMKKTVVPFRNGIMLSVAAGLAESRDCDAIVLGNHAGDHVIYPDCRTTFINPMAQAMREGTYKRVELISPFLNVSKIDIAKRASDLKLPIMFTWSCYKGGGIHCGRCGTCVERILAFKGAGVNDPTDYADSKFALTVEKPCHA